MVIKLALRQRLYNFLDRSSLKHAKQDAQKAPTKVFAFGRGPAARKIPVER